MSSLCFRRKEMIIREMERLVVNKSPLDSKNRLIMAAAMASWLQTFLVAFRPLLVTEEKKNVIVMVELRHRRPFSISVTANYSSLPSPTPLSHSSQKIKSFSINFHRSESYIAWRNRSTHPQQGNPCLHLNQYRDSLSLVLNISLNFAQLSRF